MPQIYVIYRPEDTRKKSKEIIATLQKTYGASNVGFPDFDAYVDVYQIERDIKKTNYLLVIIGNYWADMVDETGQNLLKSVYDPIHMAIATAINSRKRIIPILLDDATMPHRTRLPRELRPMATIDPIKLDKTAPIPKSLNKGLKNIIKRDGYLKVPEFVTQMKPPQLPSSSPRLRQPQPPRRMSNPSKQLLQVGIVATIAFVIIMILMFITIQSPRQNAIAEPVLATIVPTATPVTATGNPATVTDSPTQVSLPSYARITTENANQLQPIEESLVSLSSAGQFIFSQDETLFIFASPELQEIQLIDVATNTVLITLDTAPDDPLVIELSPDETILRALSSNGEVFSWGIPISSQ